MGESSVLLIDLHRLISARQWWISRNEYVCDEKNTTRRLTSGLPVSGRNCSNRDPSAWQRRSQPFSASSPRCKEPMSTSETDTHNISDQGLLQKADRRGIRCRGVSTVAGGRWPSQLRVSTSSRPVGSATSKDLPPSAKRMGNSSSDAAF